MKILLLSDTHNQHAKLELPEADMIIHSGDLTSRGSLSETISFLNWFADLPHKHKIFIAGNHDWAFADGHVKERTQQALKAYPNVIYLQDSSVTIEGIKIYGSPWQPRFYNWAFNADRGEQLKSIWSHIPDDTDILVTHGPPYGHGDKCNHGERVGCQDLLNRVLEVKPKIMVFGHIHEQYGMYRIGDDITAFNASNVNARYELVNEPVVINYYDFV